MSNLQPITRAIDFLLPPAVQEWLPESHLACYIVEVVQGLDLSALERDYGGRGIAACNGDPEHDTLAAFRRRFSKEFEEVFVSMLQVARENQLSQFGSVIWTAPRSTPRPAGTAPCPMATPTPAKRN